MKRPARRLLPLAGGLVLLSFLLILARIDARTQLLPDRLTLPLLWAGLLFNLNEVYIALPDAVAGAMAGYLALWSDYWLFRLLTGKEALGYGDFKLLAALGAWCGWQVLPQVLLLASASGLVWTLLQRLWTRQSLQQPLAFGPWLALAGGSICLWQQMVERVRTDWPGRMPPGSGGYEYFLLRRVGAALAGSSGQTCFG